jgi:sigma-B regulation protein RsbU (phosphoserine phosphatase)
MNDPARVLVVDDVEMNRDMLSRRLVRLGYAVDVAANGRRALELARTAAYDLVLLDIMMPEVDGYRVLETMKGDAELRDVPVVMISAVGEVESVVKCLELGAEDYLPKPFNPTILRARVGSTLERKRLRDQERLFAKAMERELEIGRQIQAGFLPESLPRADGWEIAARFAPARQCAGDFYDAFALESGALGLVVADVCDKGVGAALFMALFRSLLRATATQFGPGASRDEVLRRTVRSTNDYIARTHGSASMFATVFFGLLDPATGSLLYVNAGHESPFVVGGGAVRARLAPTGPALGMLPELTFGEREETISKGELLLAFTDGVTEAKGGEGFFGETRLLTVLAEPHASAESLLSELDARLAAHVGGVERSDDVTVLAVLRSL